jgi:hypothetical protein
MVGGSVLAGFVLGNLLGSRDRGHPSWESHRKHEDRPASSSSVSMRESAAGSLPNGSASSLSSQPAPSKPSLLDKVMAQFEDEIQQVKAMAVGAAIGVLRDLAKEVLPPSLAPQVGQIMDSVTSKLGGKPVRDRVIEPSAEEPLHTR